MPFISAALFAATSALSLPMMPEWDFTLTSCVVWSGSLERARRRSLMARRRGRWIFSSRAFGFMRTLFINCRLPRLSVKIVRVSFGCSASWTRAAQMAASSARVIVLVSLMPCGSTVNIFFVWGQ